jgi:predicted NBD/HSP70 family sugar kinase
VASTSALVERARTLARHGQTSSLAADPDGITCDSLQRACESGDPLALQVVGEAGRFLGLAVASLIGTLNVETIVLAGGITAFGKRLLNVVRDTAAQAMLPRLVHGTRIELSHLGHDETVLGAAALLTKDLSLLYEGVRTK